MNSSRHCLVDLAMVSTGKSRPPPPTAPPTRGTSTRSRAPSLAAPTIVSAHRTDTIEVTASIPCSRPKRRPCNGPRTTLSIPSRTRRRSGARTSVRSFSRSILKRSSSGPVTNLTFDSRTICLRWLSNATNYSSMFWIRPTRAAGDALSVGGRSLRISTRARKCLRRARTSRNTSLTPSTCSSMARNDNLVQRLLLCERWLFDKFMASFTLLSSSHTTSKQSTLPLGPSARMRTRRGTSTTAVRGRIHSNSFCGGSMTAILECATTTFDSCNILLSPM